MKHAIRAGLFSTVLLSSVSILRAEEPATTQPEGAAALYLRAAELIKTDCPAASNLDYRGYPPFPDEWHRMAKAAQEINRPARELARQARSLKTADWGELTSLNACRAVANELGDAALYIDMQGDHAAAFEYLEDTFYLAELLQEKKGQVLVRSLVGIGINALMLSRLEVIASDLHLTADPKDATNVQVTVARLWIARLLQAIDPQSMLDDALKNETFPADAKRKEITDKVLETFKRVNAESNMAAISLACHLFKFEKERWPNSLDDLLTAYLPSVPIDPWGDGKQTLGYTIVDGGLPDESDRPLVYCRCQSADGLFFRLDEPQYGFYTGDGSSLPPSEQKHGGQFRDVARWVPVPIPPGKPTTQPLR